MLNFLKNHPFAVEAFFEHSLVLTFAAPAAGLTRLIPECLSLETLDGATGFLAVAMVDTRNLRPRGFPAWTGRNFVLTGYRTFVRCTTCSGCRLRGLYILGSETNSPIMKCFGNLFTRYRYETTDVRFQANDERLAVAAPSTGFRVEVVPPANEAETAVALPEGSPFSDWTEARRFAGPLPFTFNFDAATRTVVRIEGLRRGWKPRPVRVKDFHVPFLDALQIDGVRLASAFLVEKIPYVWKKGVVERWNN